MLNTWFDPSGCLNVFEFLNKAARGLRVLGSLLILDLWFCSNLYQSRSLASGLCLHASVRHTSVSKSNVAVTQCVLHPKIDRLSGVEFQNGDTHSTLLPPLRPRGFRYMTLCLYRVSQHRIQNVELYFKVNDLISTIPNSPKIYFLFLH